MKGLILGAGVTGLSAGYKTGLPIFEATDKPGGICRSYYEEGYRFENGGGHWIFGDPCYRAFVEKYSHLEHYSRKAGVYLNTIIPYPIQNFGEESSHPGSMKRWLYDHFSMDLCRLFFFPFNQKYTAGLYESIIQDDPYKTPKNGGKGYNDRFSYPVKGLDDFVDRLAKENTIHYKKRAIEINLDKRIVFFQDNTQENYDRLISTIPLEKMMRLCNIHGYDLPYTSVIVLNIGARKGMECPKEHWLYIPGEDPFFRVGFYSNIASHFAPDNRVSIYVERSILPGYSWPNSYVNETIRALKRWGWIGDVDVVSSSSVEYAYTWLNPGSERSEYLGMLMDYGIESIGRYGRWKFQGISESIADGLGICL